MRKIQLAASLAAFALALLSLPACSQVVHHSRAEIVEHYCHAPEVTSGPEFDRIASIRQRLAPIVAKNAAEQHIHVVVVDSLVINAWDSTLSPHDSLICVPVAIVKFMGDGEGEMAFILAHETGHAVDDVCKSGTGRAGIVPPTVSGALDKLLGGSGRNLVLEQRTCEARADAIGFAIFTAAGYNPFDAAGAFGRLEMLSGDTSTGVIARLAAVGKDHPMTPDRIQRMRVLLQQQLQR